jgi:molecular chaperone DnaK
MTDKAEELAKASQKLGELMYAQAQQGAAAGAGAAGAQDGGNKPGDEKVVDAEFTEVNDKK